MADKTKIEWTTSPDGTPGATWNPLAGCTPVSEGCRNCYAASMALRLEAMGQAKYAGTAKRVSDGRAVFTGKIRLAGQDEIERPLRWRKPRRVFVNSMSDLFHDDVHPGFVYSIFEVMREAHWHTFQVLTKRPQNIMPYMKLYGIGGATEHARPWPANVWIGTSVENQAAADERIPHLLRVPARVRFLSCEPLLGPVSLDRWLGLEPGNTWAECLCDEISPEDRPCLTCDSRRWLGQQSGLHWIVVGGESGPKARPMHPDWARGLRDQAVAAGVPYFFKQWGELAPASQIDTNTLARNGFNRTRAAVVQPEGVPPFYRVGKHAAGRLLDGREWNEFPG